MWFLYEHVNFFYDLVVDWGSPHTVPDIFEFYPYTWYIGFNLKDFELLLQANEFNWIDTSSSNPESSKSITQSILISSRIYRAVSIKSYSLVFKLYN